MPILQVPYEELIEVAGKFESGQTELDAKLREIKSSVDGLTARWTGKGADAFLAFYDEFDAGIKEAVSGLEGMKTSLKGIADTYEETDSGIAQSLS
jgi:WXG100 family type VII secretion target